MKKFKRILAFMIAGLMCTNGGFTQNLFAAEKVTADPAAVKNFSSKGDENTYYTIDRLGNIFSHTDDTSNFKVGTATGEVSENLMGDFTDFNSMKLFIPKSREMGIVTKKNDDGRVEYIYYDGNDFIKEMYNYTTGYPVNLSVGAKKDIVSKNYSGDVYVLKSDSANGDGVGNNVTTLTFLCSDSMKKKYPNEWKIILKGATGYDEMAKEEQDTYNKIGRIERNFVMKVQFSYDSSYKVYDDYTITYYTQEEFEAMVNDLTYYKAEVKPASDLSLLNNGYTLTRSNETLSVDTPSVQEPREETPAQNIYTDAERDLNFDTDELNTVNNVDSALSLMQKAVDNMTDEEKQSVKAKDQLAYLAEEAAARSGAVKIKDDIVISDDVISAALGNVNNVKAQTDRLISDSDLKVRNTRSKARVETSKTGKVSVKKESISKNVDVVEAVTPYAALEYEPKNISELSIENTGTNKVKVEFTKADTTSKVNVKFSGIASDNFKAVVDEKGEVLVSKYNPITDELSAKIDKSGEFTVVTNEKDFADIKSLNANVQSAIKNLAAKGVIKGTSETEFSPEKPITRAEVAALIVRILNVDDPNADGGFVDINRAEWFFGTAGSSKREGIIAGYEDNTFRGKVVIPKVQITSVVARTLKTRLGYPDVSADILKEFSDNGSIPQWARADVAAALNSNMVIRRTDNSFEPNTEMTRGDAAVIIEKLFDKVW